MFKRISALVFFLTCFSLASFAGTVYYVDATNGSDSNNGLSPQKPWKTINKVNNSSFVPGDSILFKRGQKWRETLTPPSNGASGKSITFGAYGTGNLPMIDGTGRSYCVFGNKDYITISQLQITSASLWGIVHSKWDPYGHIFSITGWIIKNCTFTYCGVYLFGPNTIVQDCVFVGPAIRKADGAALAFYGAISANCSALRNTISHFTSRGIWFNGVGAGATVNDNVIHDIAYTVGTNWEGYGINFDGFRSPIGGIVTALRNTIYNCAREGIKTENCSEGIKFIGNLIHDCPEDGVICMNYQARGSFPPYPAYPEQRGRNVKGLLAYNVIYHCRYGISLNNVSDVDVWNNTICDLAGSYPAGLKIIDNGTYFVTDIDVRNNIFGSGMTKACTTATAWKNHLSAFDYNAVVDPAIEVRNPSSRLTLAKLQSGGDALNCFTTSPGFVDAAGHNFHLLLSSPCINAGVFVGLTRDHDGKSINGRPDIGAYESPG